MIYLIHNPTTSLYQSHKGREEWTSNISHANIFRSEKNAAFAIRESIHKWERLFQELDGTEYIHALTTLSYWRAARVVGAAIVGRSIPISSHVNES